jgi:hypothetical protein
MLIDSHAHISNEILYPLADEVLARAKKIFCRSYCEYLYRSVKCK